MSPEPLVRRKSRRGLRIAAIIAVVCAVLVVGAGIGTRAATTKHLREWTDVQALPVVAVTQPARGGSSYALELPGRLQAYSRAPIYARVNGYLKDWKVDIGASVEAGEVRAANEAAGGRS